MHPPKTFSQILKRRLAGATLATWFCLTTALAAGMLARHAVALPAPVDHARLGASLSALRAPSDDGRWLAVHVLYADCRCSRLVRDHLAHTRRPEGWSEIVLWVDDVSGEAPPADLGEHFVVKRVTVADLARFGIEAAPMLVAIDPFGGVRYAGGYTERKQGPAVLDLRILEAARARRSVAPLPLFGCAVSDRLRGELSILPSPP